VIAAKDEGGCGRNNSRFEEQFMRHYLIAATAALSFAILAAPVSAQEKAASACVKEWRAAKADFQKKGVTQKAYVEQCRGSTDTARTAGPNESKKSSRSARETERNAASPVDGTKTAKACRDEWRADKANFQIKGVTEKSYIAGCRGGQTGSTANQPAADGTSSTSRWTDIFRQNETTGTRTQPGVRTQGQYQGEAEARARCNGDTVVWANLDSKIYHFAGKKPYGHTKQGAFMCEREAMSQGIRASKSEDRPGS
jgi:hypothetical protein